MSNITGVVQSITTRATRAGDMADISVAGQRYGAGLVKYLKCKEGDYVTFEVEENGNYKNVARNSMKVSKHKPPAEAVAEAKATAGKGSSFDARQDAISRQAASNTAISWLTFLHSMDAISITATQAKSKGGAMSYLDTLRREYEKEFYEANTGNEWKNIAPNKEVEEAYEDAEEEAAAPDDEPWA